jgi:hypothetical protein
MYKGLYFQVGRKGLVTKLSLEKDSAVLQLNRENVSSALVWINIVNNMIQKEANYFCSFSIFGGVTIIKI